ncbi:MAG: tetratricopeptide repeat protein [Chthoniobacterales bacterium]
MKISTPAPTLLLAFLFFQIQTLAAQPFVADIQLDSDKTSRVELLSYNADNITVQIIGQPGKIRIGQKQIKKVDILPSKKWQEAQIAIQKNQPQKAELLLKQIATEIRPLAVIKNSNVDTYLFAYTDFLRSQKQFEKIANFLESNPLPKNAAIHSRTHALILAAYSQACLGQFEKAEIALNKIKAPSTSSDFFTFYQLAYAQTAFQRKDYLLALNELSKVIALKRPQSDFYDEALFRIAETYEAIVQNITKQQKVIAEDKRLQRLFRQNRADATKHFELIKSDPLQLLSLWDNPEDYANCATSARLQLCRIRSESPWALEAKKLLSDDERKLLEASYTTNADDSKN